MVYYPLFITLLQLTNNYIMDILLTSNDTNSCSDHCDYDAGTTCINIKDNNVLHTCDRFNDTILGKLLIQLEELV